MFCSHAIHGVKRDVKGLRNEKPIKLAHSSEMSAFLSVYDKEYIDKAWGHSFFSKFIKYLLLEHENPSLKIMSC